MDGTRFDGIARRLGAGMSRRGLLRGALGGAAVVVAGGVLADDAAAACGGAGVRCNRDAACCSGTCEWSVRRQGRRSVRVGTCAAPVDDCSIYTGPNNCMITVGGVKIISDLAFSSGPCTSSSDCVPNGNCWPGFPCDCMRQRYHPTLVPPFQEDPNGGWCMAWNPGPPV